MPVAQMNPTTDDFAALFEESFSGSGMIEGRVVPATVTIVANASSEEVQILSGTPGTAIVTATLGTSTTTSTIVSTATPAPEDPPAATPALSAYTDFLTVYRWF